VRTAAGNRQTSTRLSGELAQKCAASALVTKRPTLALSSFDGRGKKNTNEGGLMDERTIAAATRTEAPTSRNQSVRRSVRRVGPTTGTGARLTLSFRRRCCSPRASTRQSGSNPLHELSCGGGGSVASCSALLPRRQLGHSMNRVARSTAMRLSRLGRLRATKQSTTKPLRTAEPFCCFAGRT
jgi:hypothetical protein